MSVVQQLQQEISKVAQSPEEYNNIIMAMQKMSEYDRNPGVKMMQEGGLLQTQEQESVGAYVPPPKQTFDMTPEKKPVEMREGGVLGGITLRPTVSDSNTLPVKTALPVDTNPNIKTGAYNQVTVPKLDMNPTIRQGTQDVANPNYGKPTGETITRNPNIGDITAQMVSDPRLPTGTKVAPVQITEQANQMIAEGTGQLGGLAPVNTAIARTGTAQGVMPTPIDTMDVTTTGDQIEGVLGKTDDVQGQVSQTIQGQQQDKSAVSDLQSAQGVATQMVNPVQRQIQSGELVTGAANAQTAAKFTEQIQEATAEPSKKATVAGQLEGLMQQFEGGKTPAWAAGAMRRVTAEMARRGLGSSSMAGQALIQATMESALPIAQADANTVAQFEAQNLSNRQQRAMLAAQQRASFIGQEFDQAFQSRVQNASKISDVANMNFTAEQQVALENSRAAQTMNIQNLSNRQAMVMAEASALANLDMANLSNRQQAAVQNAQNFLQMDMTNLSNRQQTALFKAQQRVQSLFTDQAATNAAEQFNSTSQNQTDQFFANLNTQVSQFNATQFNAQEQFNAGQTNIVERFNAELINQREQFNAQNATVIAQANAQWRRQIATANTATINRANELNAQNLLGISNQGYNNLWQHYSDTMEWAWTSAENERSRMIELAKAQLAADANTEAQKYASNTASSTAFGKLIGTFLMGGFG